MSAPIRRLPIELVELCFRYLHKWDLCAAALACKAFSQVAKPLLWHSVFINIASSAYMQQKKAGDIALETPGNAADYDLQRFELLSNTDLGKLVRKIRYKTDTGHPEMLEPTERLFFNLDAEKVQSITISYQYISNIQIFVNLQILHVSCLYSDVDMSNGLEEPSSIPKLPSVRELIVSWPSYFKKKNVPRYLKALVTFCRYSASCPNAYKLGFDISAASLHMMDDLPALGDDADVLYEFMHKSHFPNLWRWVLLLPTDFLHSKVILSVKGEQSEVFVHEILNRFISRHKAKIGRLYLQEANSFGDFPGSHMEHVPVFPNTQMLFLGSGDAWAGARLPSLTSAYLQSLVRVDTHTLESLEINQLQLAEKWIDWFKELVVPFSNLKILKIVNITIVSIQMPGYLERHEVQKRHHQMFGDRDLVKLAEALPPKIENLSLSWWSADVLPQQILQDHTTSFLTFFEKNTSLRQLKLEHRSEEDQVLIFRRRPRDYMNPDPQRKKVCVWHLEPCHPGDSQRRHPMLYSYSEDFLQKQNYLGPDGKLWALEHKSESFLRMFRNCPENSSCRQLLLSKGYWVARPESHAAP